MESLSEIFVLSFAPGIFGLAYFFYGAKYGVIKARALTLMFLAGLLAGPLALVLFEAVEHIPVYEKAMDALDNGNTSVLFAFSLFVIGPIEELSKFFMLWLLLYRRHEFDRPVDGLTYAAAVGLGFASIENWYAMLELGSADWARAITLPFLHVLFSSFWGIGLAHAKFGNSRRMRVMIYVSLPLSFIYHGLFDFIVLSPSVSPLFVLPMVLLLWYWLSLSLRKLQDPSNKNTIQDKRPPTPLAPS